MVHFQNLPGTQHGFVQKIPGMKWRRDSGRAGGAIKGLRAMETYKNQKN